jgi:hypothetical protein
MAFDIHLEKQILTAAGNVDGDIISRLGNSTVVSSTKSLMDGAFDQAKLNRFIDDAKAMKAFLDRNDVADDLLAGTTNKIVQFIIPRADMIAKKVYDGIKNIDPRIEIVDINGVPVPVPTLDF